MNTLPPAATAGSRQYPANPGTIMGKVPRSAANGTRLTPMEKQVLDAGGWKEGDPIPDLTDTVLAKRLTAEAAAIGKAAANTEGLTPVPPNTPPIVPPEIRDISELAPAERAQYYQTMAELAEVEAKIANAKNGTVSAQSAIDMTIPGMQQAVATVSQAENAAPEPAPTASPETPAPVTICPRCGADVTAAVQLPTRIDIQNYVQAVLGGQRFYKAYQLFGGKLDIVFRSLLPAEEDAINAQIIADTDAGQLTTKTQVRVRQAEYRMALGLHSAVRSQQPEYTVTPAADYDTGPERSGVVATMRNDINEHIFVTETVRRAAAFCWSHFWGILTHLEVKATDPDFYNAIETHG